MIDTFTYEGIRANIVANPKDDAPRTVMTDWLIENGLDEWADFITYQIANPTLTYGFYAGKPFIFKRDDSLNWKTVDTDKKHFDWFDQHATQLMKLNPGIAKHGWGWNRGFDSEVRMVGNDIVEIADLKKRHPLTKIVITSYPSSEIQGFFTTIREGSWKGALKYRHQGIEIIHPPEPIVSDYGRRRSYDYQAT